MEVDYKALNDLIQQKPDLEHLSQEDVFRHLQSSPGGISSEDAGRRLQVFGSNKLEEKKENKFLKFLQFAWNPLTWAMEVAALLAIAHPNEGGKHPDWQDFFGIVMLLLIHSTINCIEENHASNAAAELLAFLSLKARVRRDGHWGEVDASILVPGDIIRIKLGDIVPADVRLLEGDPLKIDQSAHTGESFPVFKGRAESVFSGSICMQGEIDAIVYATGIQTKSRDAHLVDSPNKQGRFQKVLIAIGNFCICTVALGLLIEIIVMYPIQKRSYRSGVNNLLVLLIGGIPIAMPIVLSVTMAITSHRLSQQGVITKRMTAIEDLAGIDVLCTNKTGTLTTNKLFVNKSLVDVFPGGESVERVILMAARASRLENPDAIDAAILETLLDPNEARAGVQEIHFLPFNPTEKRTALTYIDNEGRMCRASKGAPEEILNLVGDKAVIQHRVQETINKFAEGGRHSLAVAYQEVPDRTKESPGGPWIFLGLIPLSNPSREDSAITIKKALRLGLQVKMITGDQLAIAKQAGDLLGLGVNMCTSSALFGLERDESITLPADVLIEEADGFASVLPEHKYEIVKRLQAKNHICGITGDGVHVNDAPALKIADIGIAVANATDAARDASDIVLTESGLSVIISAVLICRTIFHRMKSYMIHAVSITICTVLGFVFLTLIWKFDFPPFMVLIIAILNDGTIMVISKDRVKPCPQPDSWKLGEIFATGIVLGSYLAVVTAVFFWAAFETNFFRRTFGVATLQRGSPDDLKKVASAVYLQVSTLSRALIFVTRASKWSLIERPGLLPVLAFLCTQMVATIIAVYANWEFAEIQGIGWKWAGVILLYNLVFYIPLDFIKLLVQYAMTGKAWDHLAEQKVAFMRKKDFGRDERERRWVLAQRNIGQPKITPAYLVWILIILGGIGLGYAVTAPANMVKFDEFIEQFWPTILKNKKKAVETDVCLYTNFWLLLVSTGTPLCAFPSVWIAWIVSCKWGRKCTVLIGSVSWVVGAGLIAIAAIWFTNTQILITGLCIQGFGVGALRQVIPMICGDYFPERRDAINTIFNYSYMSGTAIANMIYYLSAENLHSGWITPTTINVSFPILLFVIGILVHEPPQQNGEIQPFWNVVIRPQLRDWVHFRNKPKVVIFVICQVLSSLVGVGSIVYVGPVLLESIKFTKRQSFLAPMVASFCGLGSFVLSDIFVYFGRRKLPVLLSYLLMGVTLTSIGITHWFQNINDELHLGEGDARLFIALSICAIIGFYIPGAPSSLTADRYYGESPYVGATFEASFRFFMTAMMGLAIFWIFCEMSFRAFLLMGCVGFLLGIFVGICVPETYRGVERDHIYDDIWRQHRIWKFVLPNTEEDLQA